MPLWNSIQGVSCCAPPGLHLNPWHVFMKSHPGSELLCSSWALFESLICLYEISSRLWVVVYLLGSIWITDIPSWNPIQVVSCCEASGLHLNYWYAFIKFHPGCELLCTSWASLKSLTCPHDIHPACELLYISWAPLASLTCPHDILSSLWVVVHLFTSLTLSLWYPIQNVGCCASSGLYSNYWHPSMKSHPESELLHTFWALLESLICPHEILSSGWVVVYLLGFIWITDMVHPPWNPIQAVSPCVSSGLHLNHWHIIFTPCLVCTYLLLPPPLTLLFWQICILQMDNIQNLMDVHFNVKLYLIFFLSLCWCILNCIGCFLILSHWSD